MKICSDHGIHPLLLLLLFFQQNLKAFYEPELSDKDTKFQWLEKNKKKTKNQLRPQIHF